MELETQYWIVESDPAKSKFDELMKQREAFFKHVKKMIKHFGAKQAAHRLTIDGFVFDGRDKVPDGWVKERHCRTATIYRPPVKGKKHQSDRDLIDSVIGVTGEVVGKEMLGCSMAWHGRGFSTPGFEDVNGTFVIAAAKLPNWKPMDGLREIKPSEYYKLKGQ